MFVRVFVIFMNSPNKKNIYMYNKKKKGNHMAWYSFKHKRVNESDKSRGLNMLVNS